jgi:hypothetical protein
MLRALLLAAALLLAQQSALAHDIWHASGAGKTQSQGGLCKLHDALGTVLGTLDAPPAAGALCALENHAFISHAPEAPGLAAPLPSSRGPPALL